LYNSKDVNAVIISTADFQHALHTVEAVNAGCDTYTEKPFAETMDDAAAALKAVKASGKIVQIGSQRRSGSNYAQAASFVQSGKFGPITMVELTWNVNQPGRWRRPDLVGKLKQEDTDWNRFLLNRRKKPGTRVSIWSSACFGPIRRACPASGCRTRLIPCIGFPACSIHAAWWQTAAFMPGKMAAAIGIPQRLFLIMVRRMMRLPAFRLFFLRACTMATNGRPKFITATAAK